LRHTASSYPVLSSSLANALANFPGQPGSKMGSAKPYKWPHMRFYAQRGSSASRDRPGHFRHQRGTGRSLESELAARGLPVFPSDTVADYWHHRIRGKQIALAMRRLEARGKGILLFHDIHPAAVAAMPGLLKRSRTKASITTSFGTRGSQVQILPLRPRSVVFCGPFRAMRRGEAPC